MTSEADGVVPSRRLELVADQADAVIGEHLRQTVRTGVRCSYWPD